ncbi:MAG: hypothetical protein QM673_06810 [Gordonia sp. (in: high G+C Gram-positive bacteria)]
MTKVLDASVEILHCQRDAILAEFNISYDEFKRRARNYALVGSEWKAWDDLRAIDFLLGDD